MDDTFRWEVGELPFIWKPLDRPTNGEGLPDSIPFNLGLNAATGTLIQEYSEDVSAALSRAYGFGSQISGLMDETGIGKQYADRFVLYLSEALGRRRFDGMRILEIGSGTGYLLSCLKQLGGSVIGIEPGSHGVDGARKYGLEIVQGFFPSPAIQSTFDLIIAYTVVEHIRDTLQFLQDVAGAIDAHGTLVVAVPDAEPYIDSGDISLLFHEHWNYFTARTLQHTLGLAGLTVAHVQKGLGDIIYASATKGAASSISSTLVDQERTRAQNLRKRAERMTACIERYFADARKRREVVGVYVPSRFVNYVAVAQIATAGLRFFDDNPHLHGTYFPGIPVPVESGADLLARPPDRVLIMSRAFGNSIARRLTEANIRADTITSLDG